MLEFTCRHCGMLITIDESFRGKPIRCQNCQTDQTVPAATREANVLAALQTFADVEAKREPRPRPPSELPPGYALLQLLGFILIAIGIIQIVVAVFILAVEKGIVFLFLGIVSGLITMGLGSAFLCLRQIGIDVWHTRRRQ